MPHENFAQNSARLLLVGLGSMGRRRMRLISRFFPKVLLGGVDSRADRRDEVNSESACEVFSSFEDALRRFSPTALLVCTPPDAHAYFLLEALRLDIHTFSELDLVDDGYDEIIPYEMSGSPAVFLSSTMLYRAENRWITENHGMTGERKFYTYHVGQYLPDWHPWEKYDEFFVGSVRTNAIREILCIELPWLTRCFGEVSEFSCAWSRTSSLNLPYPDTCQILLRHSDGTAGSLVVDCVSRKAVRNLRICGEEGTIFWEGNSESLRFLPPSGEHIHPLQGKAELDRLEGYADFISESPYLEELRGFFELVDGNQSVRRYSYSEHRKILNLADELEEGWIER